MLTSTSKTYLVALAIIELFTIFQKFNFYLDAHGLPLQMRYDEGRQFYMTFPASEVEEKPIPEDFIHIFKKKKNIECQTLDLWKRNQRVSIILIALS